MKKVYSRREFIRKNSLTGMGAIIGMKAAPTVFAGTTRDSGVPAILGGTPVRSEGWPEWPVWLVNTDEPNVIEVIRSGVWCRVVRGAHAVDEFEEKWRELIGAGRSLALVNGTNALETSVKMLDIGLGDEVITTPYTFIASITPIMEAGAMPVFADIDPDTFQIDPAKIEEKITSRTKAILPVHILGLPCDMNRIMNIARRHDLFVIEDACQAWLAEVDHRKAGTFGNAGCFSFQNSKHLAIGEGGAIVSDDNAFMDRCVSYNDNGRPYGETAPEGEGYVRMGSNLRMTEYQAAIGLAQLDRIEEETETRNRNAGYLRSKLSDVPGVLPYKLYDNVTKASFHLFPFRYKKEAFEGLARADFIRALSAEGIPAWSGYPPNLNRMSYLDDYFRSNNFRRFYPEETIDFNSYIERNRTPVNEQVCDEAVWFSQNMLLGSTSDMDDISNAVEKIHSHAGEIKAGIQD